MSGDVEGDAAQALTTLDRHRQHHQGDPKGIAMATAVLAATALFRLVPHLGGVGPDR